MCTHGELEIHTTIEKKLLSNPSCHQIASQKIGERKRIMYEGKLEKSRNRVSTASLAACTAALPYEPSGRLPPPAPVPSTDSVLFLFSLFLVKISRPCPSARVSVMEGTRRGQDRQSRAKEGSSVITGLF